MPPAKPEHGDNQQDWGEKKPDHTSYEDCPGAFGKSPFNNFPARNTHPGRACV